MLWNNDGTMTDLGVLGGRESYSRAYDINDFGQVVGYSDLNATLWSNGVMTNLGNLGESSEAHGINNSGQVVGYSNTAEGYQSAWLWTSSDGMIDLNTLLGVNSGFSHLFEATAINNKGQIVGYGETTNGETQAYLMTPVGSPSPVPVPGAVWLLGSGIAGLAGLRRSRRNA